MKKTVRILAVLLIAALCVNLSACCVTHKWKDADCTTPKTCSVCGKTEGEALGHLFSDWKPEEKDTLGGEEVRVCSVCGEKETRTAPREKPEPVTVLTEKGLTMSCVEFAEYLIGFLPDTMYITGLESEQFFIKGKYSYDDGEFTVSGESGWIVGYVRDTSAPYKSRIAVTAEDRDAACAILPYFYDAIAPSVTGSARKTAEAVIADAFNNGTNGIYLGKAELGDLRCSLLYIPSRSDHPLLTFATAKFVDA